MRLQDAPTGRSTRPCEAARETARARTSLRGTWRIFETELWDQKDLDDFTQAHLTLGSDNLGELAFLYVSADVDYRVVERDGLPAVEFSFNGFDELDPVSGRGWAETGSQCACASR